MGEPDGVLLGIVEGEPDGLVVGEPVGVFKKEHEHNKEVVVEHVTVDELNQLPAWVEVQFPR